MRCLLVGLAACASLVLAGCGFAGADVLRPLPGSEEPRLQAPSVLSPLSAASGWTSRYGETVAWVDWDGDGRDDVLIGAPGETVGRATGAGVVELHLAMEDGSYRHVRTLTQRDWLPTASEDAAFGGTLAVGDFDGDGLQDIVIAAPGERVDEQPGAGRVYVLRGTPLGEGQAIGPLADPAGPEAGAAFGAALAAGRVDANTIDDLVVGAPGATVEGVAGAGHVVVFYDAQRAPFGEDVAGPVFAEKPAEGAAFGTSLAIGDLGGDGVPEVVIGVPGQKLGRVETWRLLSAGTEEVLSTNKPSAKAQPVGTKIRFGTFIVLADVTGDGELELLVGAPEGDTLRAPKTGWVDVLFYEPARLRFKFLGRIHDIRPGPGSRFGTQLACADFNGDGFLDLAVGAPFSAGLRSEFAGHVTMFYGDGAGGLLLPLPEDRWRALLPHPGALFGASLAASTAAPGAPAYLLVGAPGTGITPHTPGRVELLAPAAP
ncbi:MAG: FG-GAP-like repeat-containing protein [Planctomycetota bacterium]|nr:FG-GAP-like repeat-containing protein [Planctomycetota bacterium]